MEKEINDAYTAMVLKNVLEKTTYGIQNNAIVSRALTDKITSEVINHKVNNQRNAISIGIRNINPKFNEKSKNYDIIKSAILDSLTNYEAVLIELSEFYDGKIEQLILRKVELESHLLGSIIRDEYLLKKEKIKIEQKEEVKEENSDNIVPEILSNNKEDDSGFDTNPIVKETDAADMEKEEKLSESVEEIKKEQEENKKKIEKMEKEIRLINEEIRRMNERKKENLFNAMEVGNKWVATTIKRPKTFTKIKRFFSSKFNTPKLIIKTIIEPLNYRIEEFVNNELSNVKG